MEKELSEHTNKKPEEKENRKRHKKTKTQEEKEFRYYFVGDSGSGKTFLMLKILKMLRQQKKKARVILYSPTANKSDLVKKHDKLFDKIVEDVNDDLIKDGVEYLEGAPFKLMIFDDVGEHAYMGNKKSELSQLVINARHEKIHMFFLVQKFTQLNRAVRRNWDVLFLFGTTDLKEIRDFREEILGHMDSKAAKDIFKRSWRKRHDFLRVAKDPPYHNFKRKRNDESLEEIKTSFSQY